MKLLLLRVEEKLPGMMKLVILKVLNTQKAVSKPFAKAIREEMGEPSIRTILV